MNLTGWEHWVFLALLVIGAVASWSFIGYYTYKFSWWRNSLGQNLVSFSGIVGVFYTWYLVLFIWPDIPYRNAVRTILFLALTLVVVWRTALFVKITRELERSNVRQQVPRKHE